MTAAAIAQLFVILAPLAKEVWVEGSKVVATFRADLSQEDLIKALELSKSASWPELTFKP
jgi:hypothetical protein